MGPKMAPFPLFGNACVKQSLVSFVEGLQSGIETGKAIMAEIVPHGVEKHEGWDRFRGHLWPPRIILA